MISLQCSVKNYDWGKLGSQSFVAQLLKAKGQVVDEGKPYAELWVGNHPSGPSIIVSQNPQLNSYPLGQLFNLFPIVLGNDSYTAKYGKNIPYLVKVLSVQKPLSIQSHPDKNLASKLYQESPSLYPDNNYKPEMVIALTNFHALCYFRPHSEIIQFFQKFEELRNLVSHNLAEQYINSSKENQKCLLKKCYTALMNADQKQIEINLISLIKKFKAVKDLSQSMFLFICDHNPGDVGCLSFFFLNYLEIKPSQAFFINVNEPHCYLKGDCIECMTTSDNVIRAGLTKKFKDLPLLCDSLTYESKTTADFMIQGEKLNETTTRYTCPFEEFEAEMIEISERDLSNCKNKIDSKNVGQIFLVLKGEGELENLTFLKAGDVYFVSANMTLTFSFVKKSLKICRVSVKNFDCN